MIIPSLGIVIAGSEPHTNIQSAIQAARQAPGLCVWIPASYPGTDAIPDNPQVPILDMRGTTGSFTGIPSVDLSTLEGGTNTAAAMVVGPGASLTYSFPGSIFASTASVAVYAAKAGETLLPFYAAGTYSADQVLGRTIFPSTSLYSFGNLSDARASLEVAATAETIFSLQKNGVQFGTITFAAAGTSGTFSASATSFNAGDVLTIVAPHTPDSTAAGLAVTLVATRAS